jgi:hypothetical protein
MSRCFSSSFVRFSGEAMHKVAYSWGMGDNATGWHTMLDWQDTTMRASLYSWATLTRAEYETVSMDGWKSLMPGDAV